MPVAATVVLMHENSLNNLDSLVEGRYTHPLRKLVYVREKVH